jgi:hypothetical protein
MTTTTLATLRPGDRLPNGAMVLHATETSDRGVVLAYTGGVQPFVTWVYRVGAPESTGSGHYTSDLADAVADYAARGGNTYERTSGDSWDQGVTITQVCVGCQDAPVHGFNKQPYSAACRYCAACCPTHG